MSLFVWSADGQGCIRNGSIAAAPYPVKREALHPHILDENKDPDSVRCERQAAARVLRRVIVSHEKDSLRQGKMALLVKMGSAARS